MDQIIRETTKDQLIERPEFSAGDNISVTYKLDKDRKQTFTGVVLYIKGHGVSRMFCIRKIAVGGIGVEKIFPLHAPVITDIVVNAKGDVRRKKISYLRGRVGKAALKIKLAK